jgi:acyl carrier protein
MNWMKSMRRVIARNYHFPERRLGNVQENPGLTAKRIIDCVGNRLRELDPDRWNTVPITFKTDFRDSSGRVDLRTVVNIHDALEREFGIEIKDRLVLISDIEAAFAIVTSHEDSN